MNKFLVLILVATSTASMADELRCWKTDFKQAKTPFMVATIVNSKTLSNVKFLYKNTPFEAANEKIVGALNTNNRSPYKGNMVYRVENNFVLMLPADLSNANLKKIEANGIGYYKGKNGKIDSIDRKDETCDSYCTTETAHLSCRSTIE